MFTGRQNNVLVFMPFYREESDKISLISRFNQHVSVRDLPQTDQLAALGKTQAGLLNSGF
jgi:hypothetical protein